MLLLSAGWRRTQIENYLPHRVRPTLPILGFDAAAVRWQAEQRARLRSNGQTPAYPDSQVAAIAAANQCVLVTRNIGGFEVYQTAGLTLENGFDEAA